MKFNKHIIYISLFAILYLIVAFSSFWHAVAFFGLANNEWMSIILAFAFEVGQAAVLFSLLTSKKDRGRVMPWVLMSMFTLVQVIGNVYSSYKYIITNSVDNLRYFKEPIFIWTDLPNEQANVIIVYLVGALLPIAALLLTSMITNYLTDRSEELNESIKFTEINSDKGPDNPPIEMHNKEEFNEVYNDENPLINQNSMLHMENQGLQESNKKKDEEINNLKKELENLKNPKIQQIPSLEINKPIPFSELEELKKVKEDDKEKKDSQPGLSGTDVGFTTTEESKTNEGRTDNEKQRGEESTEKIQSNNENIEIPEKIDNKDDDREQYKSIDDGEKPLETKDKQTEETITGDSHSNDEEPIREEDTKSNKLVGEDMNDKSGYLIGDKGDPGITDENLKVADALMGGNILTKHKKDSHFINK